LRERGVWGLRGSPTGRDPLERGLRRRIAAGHRPTRHRVAGPHPWVGRPSNVPASVSTTEGADHGQVLHRLDSRRAGVRAGDRVPDLSL